MLTVKEMEIKITSTKKKRSEFENEPGKWSHKMPSGIELCPKVCTALWKLFTQSPLSVAFSVNCNDFFS